MMSAKMAALDLLKSRLFWNKGYGVITFVHDVTNKVILRDSNYIEDVDDQSLVTLAFLWKKFS